MLGTASILLQRLFQEYRLFHEVRPQQEEQYPYNTYPLRIRQRQELEKAQRLTELTEDLMIKIDTLDAATDVPDVDVSL